MVVAGVQGPGYEAGGSARGARAADDADAGAGAGAGAGGAAASQRPPPKTCLACDKPLRDHPRISALVAAGHLAGGRVTGFKRTLERADIERIHRHPRIYGADDPAEVSDLASRPFSHLAGLAAGERSRAAALRDESEAATGDAVESKLWSGTHRIQRATVGDVTARLSMRADGLQLALECVRSHYDREFKRVEEKSTEIRVFFPVLREIVAEWSQRCETGPPAADDPLILLSLAVRRGEQEDARQRYKALFLDRISERTTAEVSRLSAIAKAARAATGGGAPSTAAAAHPAAAPAPAPAPAPAAGPPAAGGGGASRRVRVGANGKSNAALVCSVCDCVGHLHNNCPDKASAGGTASGNGAGGRRRR